MWNKTLRKSFTSRRFQISNKFNHGPGRIIKTQKDTHIYARVCVPQNKFYKYDLHQKLTKKKLFNRNFRATTVCQLPFWQRLGALFIKLLSAKTLQKSYSQSFREHLKAVNWAEGKTIRIISREGEKQGKGKEVGGIFLKYWMTVS